MTPWTRTNPSNRTPAGAVRRALLLAAALAALAGGGAARAEEPAPLAQDPAILSGRLENGLRYLLKRHAVPAGRISLWLHVHSGSLNETEEVRGLAHYLEHMAFNGSKNFPPGSVVPFFQSLGLSFGRDQNAFTSFDQTTYQLALPDAKDATVEKGLLFLSDVATRLLLLPEEVDAERSIILEERRTGLGASQRIRDAVLERLAPESIVGRRQPIGTEERIRAVKEKDFKDYYGSWYVPSNMTLIAVGDTDMAPVAKAIEKAFADGRTAPAPTPRDPGVVPPTAQRAIVATDPETTATEVSVLRVDLPRPPRTTVAELRARLVEELATRALRRRIEDALAGGKLSWSEARFSATDVGRAVRIAGIDASGAPAHWKEVLREAVLLLEQARRHGFTAREWRVAAKALTSEADEDVRQMPTRQARPLLTRMNRAVAAGDTILAPEAARDHLAALLPGISAEEVSAAFRTWFDAARLTFVVRMPSGAGVPDEAGVLAAAKEALATDPPKPVDEDRPTSFLASVPEAPATLSEEVHEASKVWSAWLPDGVRVHHRKDDTRKNQVNVTVTVAGGEIEETAATRGTSEAAALAWTRPAAVGLASTTVRDLLVGRDLRVRGSAAPDALVLTISGDPKDLEAGLQLVHRLLTDPVVEPAALAQWKESQVQEIRSRKSRPIGALSEAVGAAIWAGTPSKQPLREEDVAAVTREAAEAWLRSHVATAPIEVAVVGDLERDRAKALLATYLGTLPKRERIGPETLAAARKAERPKGPVAVRRTVKTTTQQAVVLDGMFAPDAKDVPESRRFTMAARLLSTRMSAEIREKRQLVYSIRAAFRAGTDRPGFGTFAAQAPTDPAKAEALGTALEEMYAAFAKDGPTDEELTVAKKQTAVTLEEAMRSPDFWMERLQDLDYRGLALDDVMAAPAAYQALTKEEVREAFAKRFTPEGRFRFAVVPE